jgi:hypothetical protein
MDILPAQATSVPSERVFSAAGRTLTTARSQLGSERLEMLQVMKFHYRKKEISFVSDWLEEDYTEILTHLDDYMEHLLSTRQHNDLIELLAEYC